MQYREQQPFRLVAGIVVDKKAETHFILNNTMINLNHSDSKTYPSHTQNSTPRIFKLHYCLASMESEEIIFNLNLIRLEWLFLLIHSRLSDVNATKFD